MLGAPPAPVQEKPADKTRVLKQFFRSRHAKPLPEADLYLTVGHTTLHDPAALQGLQAAGIERVVLIHDLIPVTHPEFCRPGDGEKHHARVANTLRLAGAIIQGFTKLGFGAQSLGFAALGALAGMQGVRQTIRQVRVPLIATMFVLYVIYAAIRWWQIGDAADYDSLAFFGYAALLGAVLFALDLRVPLLAMLGSGSYFIYLWHIFVVMALRDHAGLRPLGPLADSAITCALTMAASTIALLAIRRLAPPRLAIWLGA